MNQLEIEEKYSRRNIRTVVLDDIDTESVVFKRCCVAIEGLFSGTYYKSKKERLVKCQLSIASIVAELFIAVLPVKDISPIQALAAQIGNRLGYNNILDGVKTAAEIIAVCESTGLYTIYHASSRENDLETLAIRPNYKLSNETIAFINQTKYLPPMIETPVDWESNTGGGHLTGSGSVVLGAMNHHDLPLNLTAINTIQKLKWELNEDMLQLPEVPNKVLDTDDKRHQFDIFATESRQVYNDLLAAGNEFNFVWKYDSRGRMNCCGYHLNLQSTEYKKSILQFKHKELVV